MGAPLTRVLRGRYAFATGVSISARGKIAGKRERLIRDGSRVSRDRTAARRGGPPLRRPRLGPWHQRQLQRGDHARSAAAGHYGERRVEGDLTAAEILEMDADGVTAQAGSPRPSAEARLHLEIVRVRGAGAVLHALAVEHAALRSPCRGGRPRHRGLRDVEGPRGRDDARAPGMDSDSRERPGHGPAGRPGAGHARPSSGVPRAAPSPPRVPHLGETLSQAVRHVEIVEFLLEASGRRGRERAEA